MKTKVFDCVKMKDKIQEEIYREIKDLSREEQVVYYQNAIQQDPKLWEKFTSIPLSRFPIQPGPPTASG